MQAEGGNTHDFGRRNPASAELHRRLGQARLPFDMTGVVSGWHCQALRRRCRRRRTILFELSGGLARLRSGRPGQCHRRRRIRGRSDWQRWRLCSWPNCAKCSGAPQPPASNNSGQASRLSAANFSLPSALGLLLARCWLLFAFCALLFCALLPCATFVLCSLFSRLARGSLLFARLVR